MKSIINKEKQIEKTKALLNTEKHGERKEEKYLKQRHKQRKREKEGRERQTHKLGMSIYFPSNAFQLEVESPKATVTTTATTIRLTGVDRGIKIILGNKIVHVSLQNTAVEYSP